ncbi:MAG: hypothetical protein ACLQBK_12115 [Candidatus Sulfotelmatobacter sp.]
MKLLSLTLLLCVVVATTACGGGASVPQSQPLSGNWQITLQRHFNPAPPLIFTGFMLQSGNSITGSLILGSNCSGVGPVAGTVDSSNLSMIIDEFGENISLSGTMPSATTPLGGTFSNLAGGCTAYSNTGTWSAVQVSPLTGDFHGTFTSRKTKLAFNVSGAVAQGANTGDSTASITGSIQASGGSGFCSYLSQATISGIISGTTVALNLYDPDGAEITQLGQVGEINNPVVVPSPGVCGPPSNSLTEACLLVTPDGKSLTGNYTFPSISTTCTGDQGTLQISFP